MKVAAEAAEAAEELGVNIFTADVIYHLTDHWEKFMKDLSDRRKAATVCVCVCVCVYVCVFRARARAPLAARPWRRAQSAEAVFPCIARIIPTAVFNKRSPIVVGVDVLEGVLKVGTPLCVVIAAGEARRGDDGEVIECSAGVLTIGRVASIENNHAPLSVRRLFWLPARAVTPPPLPRAPDPHMRAVQEVKAGGPSVAVKIEQMDGHGAVTVGRQFEATHTLYSRVRVSHTIGPPSCARRKRARAQITRGSIDVLKANYMDEMTRTDWNLVVKLKKILGVE